MKSTTCLIAFLGLMKGLLAQESWSWQVSTWAGWDGTGDLTGAYLVPPIPGQGVCPDTGKFCIPFDTSHSMSIVHTPEEDYSTLYIHAYDGPDCTGNWVAYSSKESAVFNIDTGGPVYSVHLLAGLCGAPW